MSVVCFVLGHRFFRREQVSPWSYSLIAQQHCIRCPASAEA